jgi:hypothetical protein
MPLIKPKPKIEKVKNQITIDKSVYEEMEKYAQWAGFEKVDEAIEESIKRLLKRDKEWCAHNKMQ